MRRGGSGAGSPMSARRWCTGCVAKTNAIRGAKITWGEKVIGRGQATGDGRRHEEDHIRRASARQWRSLNSLFANCIQPGEHFVRELESGRPEVLMQVIDRGGARDQ